ncbi:hypothetical protein SK128_001668 [Halocaridina rubra]|uniref:Uncharacterized protein n=1 Tax=Halocaridina rubra TaxID=373956 RepID=A0AAN9AC05_HALRR
MKLSEAPQSSFRADYPVTIIDLGFAGIGGGIARIGGLRGVMIRQPAPPPPPYPGHPPPPYPRPQFLTVDLDFYVRAILGLSGGRRANWSVNYRRQA